MPLKDLYLNFAYLILPVGVVFAADAVVGMFELIFSNIEEYIKVSVVRVEELPNN